MRYSIPQMEAALVAALQPMKTSHSVRTIKEYEGELEVDDLRKMRVPAPAILVVWIGAVYEDFGERQIEDNRFTVFCCDKILRNLGGIGGRGDHPGTHTMVREVRRLLAGVEVLEGAYPCMPAAQGERTVGFGDGYSIVAGVYSVKQGFLIPEG